jgi:hypothetical protein
MRFKYAEVPLFRGISLDSDSVVRKTWISSSKEYAKEVGQVVNYFIRNPDPLVVPVYDWQYFGRSDYGYKYSYSMMRMGALTREEKQIINAAGDHKKDFLMDPFQTCADDHCEGLTTDYPTLVGYLQSVIQQGRYLDLHSGNIMLDLEENYRLIDLEGFISGDDKKNLWFK